jgi:hypothetical protein
MPVIHIGLPKTGTTYLQHRIFRKVSGLRFIHRALGPEEARLCAALRAYVGASGFKAALIRRQFGPALARFTPSGSSAAPTPTIVSDENISLHSGGFWRGEGPGPDQVAERLMAIAESAPEALGPVRVLLGIRRQDHWLASRYAESARHVADLGQTDFERRLRMIAQTTDLVGPQAWLDQLRTYEAFAGRFGADRVIILRQEDLAERPGATLERLGRQLGGLDLARIHRRARRHKAGQQLNRLSTAEGTWMLRGQHEALTLGDALSEAIIERFAPSNRALATLLAEQGEAPEVRP